jgi:hypothetical protein
MLGSIRREDDTAKKTGLSRGPAPRHGRDQKIVVVVLALSGVVHYYTTKSPKYLDDVKTETENVMNTSISTKLAALSLALLINSVIMGSVALMFNGRLHETSVQTVARVVDQTRDAA